MIGNIVELRFFYFSPVKRPSFKNRNQRNNTINNLITADPMQSDLFTIISGEIANVFGCNIRLYPTKLYKIFYDSTMIKEFLSLLAMKMNLTRSIFKMFVKARSYQRPLDIYRTPRSAGHLAGIFIRISGRTFRQKLTNRRLLQTSEKGRIARKSAIIADTARVTRFGKYGSFSITVTTGHNY